MVLCGRHLLSKSTTTRLATSRYWPRSKRIDTFRLVFVNPCPDSTTATPPTPVTIPALPLLLPLLLPLPPSLAYPCPYCYPTIAPAPNIPPPSSGGNKEYAGGDILGNEATSMRRSGAPLIKRQDQ